MRRLPSWKPIWPSSLMLTKTIRFSKVLKITSATVNTRLGPASTTYGYSYAKFFIDGHLLAQYYASSYRDFNYGNVLNNNPFPLWLGAGTYQVAINSFQTQGGGCSISGVEFNLTSE